MRVRWSGELLAPADGQYGFSVHTDGQARLRIDGQDALTGCGSPDAAQSHIPDTAQGGATLKAGWRRIEFDYIAQPGHDVAELYWAPPNGASELIPMSALRFAPEDNPLGYTAPQPPEAIDCAATTIAPPAPTGRTPVVPSAILGADAGLKAPRGLAVDAGGQIFVADSGNARIVPAGCDGQSHG